VYHYLTGLFLDTCVYCYVLIISLMATLSCVFLPSGVVRECDLHPGRLCGQRVLWWGPDCHLHRLDEEQKRTMHPMTHFNSQSICNTLYLIRDVRSFLTVWHVQLTQNSWRRSDMKSIFHILLRLFQAGWRVWPRSPRRLRPAPETRSAWVRRSSPK